MYSWHDTLHMGIVHCMAYPQAQDREEIKRTVKAILTDTFFQAVEVSALLERDVLKEIGRMCEVARVECLIAAQPLVLSGGLNLNALQGEERQKALSALKEAIDKAYIARAKILGLLSGKRPEKDEEEKARNILVDSLLELCQYAKERAKDYGYTLHLNLEVFDYAIDKKALIGPATFAFDVASRVKAMCRNFGLTIDLSHEPLLFEEPSYALSLLAPFVTHVHIGNAVLEAGHPAYGDLHPRFGIPGGLNDVGEVVAFLKALVRSGFFEKETATEKPVISFEVKPLPGEDPDLVVANAKRTFLVAWNRLFPMSWR
jgi:sugar phosphate isomerase/epimerase